MSRSRSQQAHERVLRAALDLFGTRGIDATSMDAISQASGVSKATIYNHWTNKEAMLLDVMLMIHGANRDSEDIDSGDARQDLITVLSRRPPDEFGPARDRMMPGMVAYSALHHDFGQAWRHRVMEPARVQLKRILRRGIQRKQLPASLDMDAAMALLLGPLLYAKIFGKEAPIKDVELQVVDSFWRSHATDGAPKSRAKWKR